MNNYQYVVNPTGWIDPLGLEQVDKQTVEDVVPNSVVRNRDTIIQGLGDTVQPHVADILKLDPNAQVGVRGSLVRGTKGPHKDNAPFNPNDFDVDAFIVSDELASQFPRRARFRDDGDINGIATIQDSQFFFIQGNN